MNTKLKKLDIEIILAKVQKLTARSFHWYFVDRATIRQKSRYDAMIRKAAANMIINLD